MQLVWAGIIIAALVVEAITAQLVSIWFLPAALVSLIISFISPGLVWLQILVFVVISFVLILLSRTIFKKYLVPKITRTNLDSVIGDTGIVIEDINNIKNAGAVRIQGKIWSARSEDGSDIPCDTLVTVSRIEGVKLICKVK